MNNGIVEDPKYIKLSKLMPTEVKNMYLKLFKEYIGVFSWKYKYLRTCDTSIIQHKIPLRPGVKPLKQKLRKTNPLLLPIIEKEVRKLLDAKIIIPLRYLEWVEKLVQVKNKSGEIKLF